MEQLLNHLNCRPQDGIFTAFAGLIISILPNWLINNKSEILWLFQMAVAAVGFIAGVLTIIAKRNELKKQRKKKCK